VVPIERQYLPSGTNSVRPAERSSACALCLSEQFRSWRPLTRNPTREAYVIDARGEKKIRIAVLPRDAWSPSSTIDVNTNTIVSADLDTFENVAIAATFGLFDASSARRVFATCF
jgi:hypothetical protein